MPERAPRLVGEARDVLARDLARRYRAGASIRSLSRDAGRSYGLVQKLLTEAGVEFRPRGGADPASPRTRAEREATQQPDAAPQDAGVRSDDELGSNAADGPTAEESADGSAEVDALRLAVETAVARAEKADRKARKAEKALRKLRRKDAGKSKRRRAKALLEKRRAKAEKARRRVRKAQRRLDEAEHGSLMMDS